MSVSLSVAREGMGVIGHENDTSFLVWAPHEASVSVLGSFNHWSPDAHSLVPAGNGRFALDVPDAKPGDEYRFEIRNGDARFSRIDPASS